MVSGPSGAGKTSVMRRVYQSCRVPLVRSVSATTRPPRADETDGVDYHFVTNDEFQLLRRRGEFLECFEVFGQAHWYGTLRSAVTSGLSRGKWVVLEIDVQGALEVMRQYADAITIFLRPSSREELERRLRGRGTETEQAVRGPAGPGRAGVGHGRPLPISSYQRRHGPGGPGNKRDSDQPVGEEPK